MKIPSVQVVVRVGIEQMEALAALPGSIVLLNRSLTNFARTINRLDQLVRRLDRLTEPLEAPMAALAPRLDALVPLLDEELIKSLAAAVESVPRTAAPALELLGQSQAQMATIAAGLDRLTAFMEAGYGRLQNQPAATLAGLLLGTGGGPKGAPSAGGSGPGAAGAGESASKAEAEAEGTDSAGGETGGTGAVGTQQGATGPVPGPAPRAPRPSRPSSTTEEHRSWRG